MRIIISAMQHCQDGRLQIREMEYIMAHESIPIAQERQMVKHIKKLRDQRQRVRQYEEMYAGVETARAAARSGQGELKELLQERQVCITFYDCLSGGKDIDYTTAMINILMGIQ